MTLGNHMRNTRLHPGSRPARIVIVDDHPLVREGLTLRISTESDLEVCGEAESLGQALEVVRGTQPDLVLVDLSLKDSHGLDLLRQLSAQSSPPLLLVLSMYDESHFAERVLQAGARGYLNKHESRETIVDAIRTVLAGKLFLSQTMTQRLLNRVMHAGQSTELDALNELTDREMQVFQMIGEGLATREIAGRLHLSVHTVETHREKIKRKLGVNNSVELTRQAVQWVLENG